MRASLRILQQLGEIHKRGLLHEDFAERNVLEHNGDIRIIDFDQTAHHKCDCDMDFRPGQKLPDANNFGCDQLWEICRYRMRLWSQYTRIPTVKIISKSHSFLWYNSHRKLKSNVVSICWIYTRFPQSPFHSIAIYIYINSALPWNEFSILQATNYFNAAQQKCPQPAAQGCPASSATVAALDVLFGGLVPMSPEIPAAPLCVLSPDSCGVNGIALVERRPRSFDDVEGGRSSMGWFK